MLKGKVRVTMFTAEREMFADDISEGDFWLFPGGAPQSIQGLKGDGCEFLLVFNQDLFSEESAFQLSGWLMHTPPEILRSNFRPGADAIGKLPKNEPLYIFPSALLGQMLEQDIRGGAAVEAICDILHPQGEHDGADRQGPSLTALFRRTLKSSRGAVPASLQA